MAGVCDNLEKGSSEYKLCIARQKSHMDRNKEAISPLRDEQGGIIAGRIQERGSQRPERDSLTERKGKKKYPGLTY